MLFILGADGISCSDIDSVSTSFPNFKLYKVLSKNQLGYYAYDGGMAGLYIFLINSNLILIIKNI